MKANMLLFFLVLHLLLVQSLPTGQDKSLVNIYSSNHGRTLNVDVSVPFNGDKLNPSRVVLDFQPWNGNFESFGACENIIPSLEYLDYLNSTRWDVPVSCDSITSGEGLLTYPQVTEPGDDNQFWTSMSCNSTIGAVLWKGSIPISKLTSTCIDKKNDTLFTVSNSSGSTTYTGFLYKTVLTPDSFVSLTTDFATLCTTGVTEAFCGTCTDGTLDSIHYHVGKFEVDGKIVGERGAPLESFITSDDVLAKKIGDLPAPFNDVKGYYLAFTLQATDVDSSYLYMDGTVYIYNSNLFDVESPLTSNSTGVLETGTMKAKFARLADGEKADQLLSYTILFDEGVKKPKGFPIDFDLSPGNPFTSSPEGIDTETDDTMGPNNVTNYRFKWSFASSDSGVASSEAKVPITFTLSKSDGSIQTIAPVNSPTYSNPEWFVVGNTNGTFIYSVKFSAYLPVQGGFKASVISNMAQSMGPFIADAQFKVTGSTIEGPKYGDLGLVYYEQKFEMTTQLTDIPPYTFVGKFEFAGSVSQCVLDVAPRVPVTGVVCSSNSYNHSFVLQARKHKGDIPPTQVILPVNTRLGTVQGDFTDPASYRTVLDNIENIESFTQGQRVYALVKFDDKTVSSEDQYAVLIKEVHLCVPENPKSEVTYDGLEELGCLGTTTGTVLSKSFSIITNYKESEAYTSVRSFGTHLIQAPNVSPNNTDYRYSGFNFMTSNMPSYSRWFIHIVLDIKEPTTTENAKRISPEKKLISINPINGKNVTNVIIESFYLNAQPTQEKNLPVTPVKQSPAEASSGDIDRSLQIATLVLVCVIVFFLLIFAIKMIFDSLSGADRKRKAR